LHQHQQRKALGNVDKHETTECRTISGVPKSRAKHKQPCTAPDFPGISGGSGTHAIWQMNFPANKQLCCCRTARTSQSPPAALFQVAAGQYWHRNASRIVLNSIQTTKPGGATKQL